MTGNYLSVLVKPYPAEVAARSTESNLEVHMSCVLRLTPAEGETPASPLKNINTSRADTLQNIYKPAKNNR